MRPFRCISLGQMLGGWSPTYILGSRDKGSLQRNFYMLKEAYRILGVGLRTVFCPYTGIDMQAAEFLEEGHSALKHLRTCQWTVNSKETWVFFCLCFPDQVDMVHVRVPWYRLNSLMWLSMTWLPIPLKSIKILIMVQAVQSSSSGQRSPDLCQLRMLVRVGLSGWTLRQAGRQAS